MRILLSFQYYLFSWVFPGKVVRNWGRSSRGISHVLNSSLAPLHYRDLGGKGYFLFLFYYSDFLSHRRLSKVCYIWLDSPERHDQVLMGNEIFFESHMVTDSLSITFPRLTSIPFVTSMELEGSHSLCDLSFLHLGGPVSCKPCYVICHSKHWTWLLYRNYRTTVHRKNVVRGWDWDYMRVEEQCWRTGDSEVR